MAIFVEQISSDEIKEILTYYYDLGGKRLRPALFLAVSKLFESTENIGPFILVLELMHNMSLYHDDVLDNTVERRGAPTVHVKWNTTTAIVGGDIFHGLIHNHLISAILQKRIKNPDKALKFLNELIVAVEQPIGEAVIHEMRFSNSDEIPPIELINKVTRMKTAPLFSFSASSAAMLAGQSFEIVQMLYDFGDKLGFAFQLLDDVGDFFNSNKGMGNDLKDFKKTPVISLVNKKNPSRLATYMNKRNNITEEDIINFRSEFKDCLLEVISWAEDNLVDAKNIINKIDKVSQNGLIRLIIYLLETKIKQYRAKLSK